MYFIVNVDRTQAYINIFSYIYINMFNVRKYLVVVEATK